MSKPAVSWIVGPSDSSGSDTSQEDNLNLLRSQLLDTIPQPRNMGQSPASLPESSADSRRSNSEPIAAFDDANNDVFLSSSNSPLSDEQREALRQQIIAERKNSSSQQASAPAASPRSPDAGSAPAFPQILSNFK